MSKKILELCMSPDLGGLELYFLRLSEYLQQKGEVFAIVNENGKLLESVKKAQLPYKSYKRAKGLGTLFLAKKIAKVVDEEGIELIHIHWTKDILLAVLIKLFSKHTPKLVQTRHMRITRFKNDFYHRFIYKHVDAIIGVTKQVKEQLERFIPSDIAPKIESIYIGAADVSLLEKKRREELRQQYALDDAFTLGIVGRIEEAKGQKLLIDALGYLKSQGFKDIKLLIVGHTMDDSYLQSLKEYVKSLGLESSVIFTGFSSEVQNLMQICDVIVLATENETFGLVLIEAMQAGIAVLGSDKGGPLEIIEDQESGLLFKSFDSDDLAQKISTLYNYPQKRIEMAVDGQERAKELFDDTKQFEKVHNMLESLV